jgi:tRNA threonylcarbamoyladenosine biosynthesis protein TsaB
VKILALESSAVAASVALTEDDILLAQSFQNSGLTHSRTLMPLCEDLLKNMELTLDDVDLIAVAAGPGSFTGLRIGVSAVKGLAWAGEKPCCGVSTLEAMAWTVAHMGGEICAVMDARRKQVYNARFTVQDGVPVRLTEDRAISLEELCEEIIRDGSKPQILIGDGLQISRVAFEGKGLQTILPPPHLRLQSAWGVARGALELAKAGKTVSAAELTPEYHRLSQAERERAERLAQNKE